MKSALVYLFIIMVQITGAERQILFAEDTKESFESMTLGIDCISILNHNTFHQYWDPAIGAKISIETPFYYGDIRSGVELYPFNGKNESFPDFFSAYFFLGWGKYFQVSSGLHWYNGLRVGSYRMSFDDDEIDETQVVESELGFGFDSGLKLNISSNWAIHGQFYYLVVYTKKHLEFTMFSAGCSYTFDSPQWLKEFLK
jgi:hypothetical protein